MGVVREDTPLPWSREGRTIIVDPTPGQIVGGILLLQTALLAVIGIERLGFQLPIIRGGLTFVYLTFLPGFLFISILGAQFERKTERLVFIVGISLALLMGFGAGINLALRGLGYPTPITELPVVLSISGLILVMTGIYYAHVDESGGLNVDPDLLWSPWTLGLAVLPVLGIYGGLILTRYGNNWLLLALYVAIAAIPFVVILDRLPKPLFTFALWAIAVSLLLQNTLTGTFLAWGDQPREAAIILRVLESGFWSPTESVFFANKYAMLRISILHPIYMMFSDLELFWAMRLYHPLIISLTPVALFNAYRRLIGDRDGFLAAFLYLSLFSFFIVLSRNTRTGTAVFFLALLIILLTDTALRRPHAKLFAFIVVLSLIVSHYGASYMFLLAIGITLGTLAVIQFVTDSRSYSITSTTFVMLYVASIFAWYIYASPGSGSFSLFVRFADFFLTTLQEQFLSPETSATTRIVTFDWQSITLETLKYYNLAIGGITGIGIGILGLRTFLDRETPIQREYFAFGIAFFVAFGITFLPVERFNTARTFAISFVVLAPFFIFGLRSLRDLSRTVVGDHLPRVSLRKIATVVVVVYFLLNVGFISATLTHEYAPNALVEKDRIMANGQPPEVQYFYRQYPTEYHMKGSAWLARHVGSEQTVYTSGSPGAPRIPLGHSEYRGLIASYNSRSLAPDTAINESDIVFLGASSEISGLIMVWGGHFNRNYYSTDEFQSKWENKSRVYTNGGTTVYH